MAVLAVLAVAVSVAIVSIIVSVRTRLDETARFAAGVRLLSELESAIEDLHRAGPPGQLDRVRLGTVRDSAERAATDTSPSGIVARCGLAALAYVDTLESGEALEPASAATIRGLVREAKREVRFRLGGLSVELRHARHRLFALGLLACVLLLVTAFTFVGWIRAARGNSAASSAQRRSEMLFTNLFHCSNDAILIYDLEGRILECNRKGLDLFGYDRAAVRRLRVPELHPPSAHATCRAALEEASRAGVVRFETEALRADGSVFAADVAASRFEMDGERFVQCILRDATNRHRQMAELRDAKERAEQASRAKSFFLANISHEIRTPMNGVIGMTRLLLGGRLKSEERALAVTIQDSADALLRILDDILDLTNAEAGKLSLSPADFELGQVLSGCIALHEATAKEQGLELRLECADDLPAWVRGDPARLRQVLNNLIGNAVKFTDRGSVTIEAQRGSATNDDLVFLVRDTGRGIPPECLETVFDSFVQIDPTSSRSHGGAGLGLAIAQRLVRLMGGSIDVRSRPGKGACFRVRVPLPSVAPAASSTPDPGTAGRPLTLLVVEDGEINREVASGMLKRMGHAVTCVEDGRSALQRIAENEFDAVLLDIQMPGMDGFEVARRIRAKQPPERARLPLIAFTAQALSTDRERCLAAGMDDHLSKPVLPGELAAVLARWCPPEPPHQRDDERGDAQPLDREHFETITSGDLDLQQQLIRVFRRETPQLIGAITAAVSDGDLATAREHLHKLRGSADSLGASGLSDACRRLGKELASGSGNAQDLQERSSLAGLRNRWQGGGRERTPDDPESTGFRTNRGAARAGRR
jgi:PAS domain S-box-containing protein